MKDKYPSYRKQGVEWIEQSLTGKAKQIYQDYISFLSGTAGARKMKDYRMYTLQFIDIMEKPIYQLAPQDFVNFWALVNQDNERTVATKNSIKLTIKRFGKWYYKDNLKMRDTLESLKLKSQIVNKEKINKNNLVTDKELELMIRSCKNYRDIAVLITSYESACRPHELRLAKWKDINWDNKTISFFSTKTKEAREVPLKEAIKHLKVWRQAFQFPNVTDQDYIFPSSQDRNKPVIEWTFRNWIIEAGKRAGIKRTIYPYLLRHSRISL